MSGGGRSTIGRCIHCGAQLVPSVTLRASALGPGPVVYVCSAGQQAPFVGPDHHGTLAYRCGALTATGEAFVARLLALAEAREAETQYLVARRTDGYHGQAEAERHYRSAVQRLRAAEAAYQSLAAAAERRAA